MSEEDEVKKQNDLENFKKLEQQQKKLIDAVITDRHKQMIKQFAKATEPYAIKNNPELYKAIEIAGKQVEIANKSMTDQLKKNLIKTIKLITPEFENNLANIKKSIESTFLILSKSITISPEVIIDDKEIIRLSSLGWAIPTFLPISSVLIHTKKLTDSEVDKYFLKLYTRDNSTYTKYSLNEIEQALPDDFKIIVSQIIELLSKNYNYYKVSFANLFVILEHIAAIKFADGKKTKELLNKTMISKLISQTKEKESSYKLAYTENLENLKPFFSRIEFTSDDLKLTRHTYMHGRYSPENITYIDFIKFVNKLSLLVLEL